MRKIFIVFLAGVVLTFTGCGNTSPKNSPNEKSSVNNTVTTTNETQVTSTPDVVQKPWVEVERATVNLMDSNGKILRQLENGDELEEGQIVETDKSGLANIYFPDGSVARLSESTKITLVVANYNSEDNSLVAKISLSFGKIWSKILHLATPESSWEVETSNAVAAVRGTAFGMDYLSGKTRILGSEHTVSVHPIDFRTHKLIDKEALVDAGKMIEISNADLAKIMAQDFKFDSRVKVEAAGILREDWVTKAEKADRAIDLKLQQLQANGLSETKASEAVRRDIISRFQNILRKRDLHLDNPESNFVSPSSAIKILDRLKTTATVKTASDPTLTGTTSTSSTLKVHSVNGYINNISSSQNNLNKLPLTHL